MQGKLEGDIKTALLAGDKTRAEVLKNLKNALLYEAVSLGAREQGLSDDQAQKVVAREVKKRVEAAELYQKAGEAARAQAELSEKAVLETYLPEQVSKEEIAVEVKAQISKLGASNMADMGKVIGAVKSRFGNSADGSIIARLVKEALES